SCHVCTGPLVICENLHRPQACDPPNNYCINHIVNHNDGCGNFDTCYREWWQGTSDEDKCEDLSTNNQKLDFQCTFCCVSDNCNIPVRPAESTLYKPKLSA
ncbi:hypothetical protein MAR_033538, partial [Mya arenaria]